MSFEQKKVLTNTNALPEYIEFQRRKRALQDANFRPVTEARITVNRIALNARCDWLKIKPIFDAVLKKHEPKVLISPLKTNYSFYPYVAIVNETIEELVRLGHINRAHATTCGYPVTEAPKPITIVRRLSAPTAHD